MKTRKFRAIAILYTLIAFSLSFAAQAETLSVDPAATEILKKMTDHLGSVKQFSVQTQNTLEDLLISGHRIDIDVSSKVIISRPNMLRAERKGDLVDQVFYYNGKQLTLYNPLSKVYATTSAPDTFEGLFKHIYETLGFGVPVSDLVYSDAYPLLIKDVNLAAIIGSTFINGVRCHHLLFSRPGVDFQIWVSEGADPLPYKYVITDTASVDRLSVITYLTQWNVAPGVQESEFTFIPPKGTEQINFITN
jgi:hypothetical protein